MVNSGNLLLANIIDYLTQIRKGNLDKKDEISIKLITGTGEYGILTKIIIDKYEFSYIKMITVGFNVILDPEVQERPSYNIKPLEISKSFYTENGLKYTKYRFHELQTRQNGVPFADTRECSGLTRIEVSVLSSESLKFEQYLYPMDDVFLETVTWVSQFDESVFGLCSGCWSSSCCRRACEYMLGNTNIANCTDKIIAETAPYMAVSGSICLANFLDNTSRYTLESYNSTILNSNSGNIDVAIKYIRDKLKAGRPVIIGVYFGEGSSTPPNNANRATRHFMVVVGMGIDKGNEYFRFYDPGRTIRNKAAATSQTNKLILNRQKGFFQGTYNSKTYSITEIIKTN